MKALFRIPLVVGWLAAAANVGATVISDDAALGPGAPFGEYQLSLTASIPPGEGALFITFDSAGGNLFGFSTSANTYAIAERFTLYELTYGAAFTPDYVAGATPLFDNTGPANWQIAIPLYASIYLAIWDDRETFDNAPTANDSYGWIQLTHTASGLAGSASATALGGGIVVGTTSQIPEPATAALLALGALVLARVRRTSA